MTPKQKAEQKQAELRRQLLEQSGMVEGLKQSQPDRPKKVVYGNRKKKPGPQKDTDNLSVTQVSTPETMSPALKTDDLPVSEPPETPQSAASPMVDVKDDWDAESEEEKPAEPAPGADVKSDWDASSEDEAPSKPVAEGEIMLSHVEFVQSTHRDNLQRKPSQVLQLHQKPLRLRSKRLRPRRLARYRNQHQSRRLPRRTSQNPNPRKIQRRTLMTGGRGRLRRSLVDSLGAGPGQRPSSFPKTCDRHSRSRWSRSQLETARG